MELTFDRDFDELIGNEPLRANFENGLKTQLAQAANVDEDAVEIELSRGSVIATSTIQIPEDQNAEDTAQFLDDVENDVSSILGTTFTEQFGVPESKVNTVPEGLQEKLDEANETENEESLDDMEEIMNDDDARMNSMVGAIALGACVALFI